MCVIYGTFFSFIAGAEFFLSTNERRARAVVPAGGATRGPIRIACATPPKVLLCISHDMTGRKNVDEEGSLSRETGRVCGSNRAVTCDTFRLSLSLSLSLFLSPSHAPIVKAPHISAMLYACACVHGWVEREAEMVGVT